MIEIIVLSAVLVVVILGYFLYGYFDNRRNNEVIPYSYGDVTMFLRRYEIPHFEALGRKEKRRVVNSFSAKVKSGDFVAIYNKGALSGYIRKVKK